MQLSGFRRLCVTAIAAVLIVGGANPAYAEPQELNLVTTVTPNNGTYVIADGDDSWVLQVAVTDQGAPAELPDPGALTAVSSSDAVTISSFANPSAGIYTARIKTATAGSYPLTVQYEGEPNASPTVYFHSSDPDPSESTLIAVPETITATCGAAVLDDPVRATATVRDDQGVVVPGVEVTFESEGNPSQTLPTDVNGIATVELVFDVPDEPAMKTVNASVDARGLSVELSTATVVIQPAEGCTDEAVQVNWMLETSTQVAGLGIRMLITALDGNGQVARMDAEKLTVTPSSTAVSVGPLTPRVNGSYSVSLTSASPGGFTVGLTYDQKTDGRSLPFSFVAPAPLPDVTPDVDQSYVYASKWLVNPDDQVVVTAAVNDSEGRGVEGAQVSFSIYQSDTYQTTCVTLSDGLCSIPVTLPAGGRLDVDAQIRDQGFGETQHISFLPGDEAHYLVSIQAEEASGDPVRADGYDPWSAQITILNPDGTPVEDLLDIGLTVIDASTMSMVSALKPTVYGPQPDGVYATYITSSVPGSYLVYANYDWTWSDPVIMSFIKVDPDEPGARLALSDAQVNVDDPEFQAIAMVHDEQGHPTSGVRVSFSSNGDTDVLSARQCYTDNDGTCSILVWLNGLGEHLVSANVANEPLTGSPSSAQLVPRMGLSPWDPPFTLGDFTVAPKAGESVPADGVSQWVGTVSLTPGFQSDLTGLSDDVLTMLTPSNPAVAVGAVSDNKDNTYTVSFTSTLPGEYMVTAYYKGTAIERPITFTGGPGVPDPEQSSVVAQSGLAETGAQVVLTAMVKDSSGDLVTGAAVSFTADAPGVLSKPACTTESDGRCSVSVTSNADATVHVGAYVNDQELSGSPVSVSFHSTQPTTSPTQSSTQPPTTSPTQSATQSPTSSATQSPTTRPTQSATQSSTSTPAQSATSSQTGSPTVNPTRSQTSSPAQSSTSAPPQSSTGSPTTGPTQSSTGSPTQSATASPTQSLTSTPTLTPTESPTLSSPTTTQSSTSSPAQSQTTSSTVTPTQSLTSSPTSPPATQTSAPTVTATQSLTTAPTQSSSSSPTFTPSEPASTSPTQSLTSAPTQSQTTVPTQSPTATSTQPQRGSPSGSETMSPATSSASATLSPTVTASQSTVSPTVTVSSSSAPTGGPTTQPTQSVTSGPTTTTSQSPASSGTAPTSSATSTPDIHIQLSTQALAVGQVLWLGGGSWVPGESVHITVHSVERDLGTLTADADGVIAPLSFTIPSDFETGLHLVTAVGSVSGTHVTTFTVVGSVSSPPPSTSAPATNAPATSGPVTSAPPAVSMPTTGVPATSRPVTSTPIISTGGTSVPVPDAWSLLGFTFIGLGAWIPGRIRRTTR